MNNVLDGLQKDHPGLVALAEEVSAGGNTEFKKLIPREMLEHLESSADYKLSDYIHQADLNETQVSILVFLRNNVQVKQGGNGQLERVYTGTLKKYTEVLCRLFNHAKIQVRGIRSHHLADYIYTRLELRLSANTVNLEIRAMRSFFRFLHQSGFMPQNPAGTIKEIKGGKKHHFSHTLSFEQAREILLYAKENLPFRDFVMLSTLRFAGLRAEEVVSLRYSNLIQGVTGCWFLQVTGKGNKTREVPIPSSLAKDILEHRFKVFSVPRDRLDVPGLRNVPVFSKLHRPFNALTYSSVYYLVAKVSEKVIGKKISPHWFRHTFATHASMKGIDIKTVSLFLGHNSINTTMIYEQSFELQKGNYGKILAEEYV